VHAAKIKVTLWRDVGDVGCYPPLLAQLPDLRRGLRVVDGGQDHVDAIEVGGLELAVDIVDLLLLNSVGDLGIQAFARRDDSDFGVGIEHVHDAASGDLRYSQSSIPWRAHSMPTHFAATHYQHALVPDLPGEDQRTAALDFRVLVSHGGHCVQRGGAWCVEMGASAARNGVGQGCRLHRGGRYR
jgi:hypothetical protein